MEKDFLEIILVKMVAVIPTLAENPSVTISSIQNQTVKVSKTLVAIGSMKLYEELSSRNLLDVEYTYVRPDFRQPLGVRVTVALNTILAGESVQKYDYIMKTDADAQLPRRFIEENLKENADCCGGSGYAMIIKVSSFMKVFGGRFPEVAADDTYLGLEFMRRGYIFKDWRLPPASMRKPHHSYRHQFIWGAELYKMGYEPIHVLARIREHRREILTACAYVSAMLKRTRKYELASWVFNAQIRRILYGKHSD